MFSAEGREARARLEAHRRARPGDDLDALTRAVMAGMMAADDDDHLDEWADAAPVMTPPQLARIRRLATTPASPPAEAVA